MKKSLRRAAFALAALLLLSVVVWKAMPRDRMLLRIATPVASTADWALKDPSMPDFVPYYWISNREALFFRTGPTGGVKLFRQQIASGGRAGIPVALPMPEIAPQWRPQRLSPDGKWLFWTHWIRPAHLIPMATALDGSRTVIWRQPVLSPRLKWLPDGRRLADLTWSNSWMAQVLSVDHPEAQSIPVPGFDNRDHVALLGFTADGHAIGVMGNSIYTRAGGSVDYALFSLGRQASSPQRFTLMGPPGTNTGAATPSPQGDRLLWSCNAVFTSPVAELLQRIFPGYRAQRQSGHTWWVSRLDGGGMHEIGRIADRDDDGGIWLQWLPDGRRASFVYKGRLYVVPAD